MKKIKQGSCSYHLCEKKNVTVHKCKYCGKYYCEEHLNAKAPMLAPFRSTNIEDHLKWREKGHPCPEYAVSPKVERPIFIKKVNKKSITPVINVTPIDEPKSPIPIKEPPEEPEIPTPPPEPTSQPKPEPEPENVLDSEPELNIEEKEDERLSVSDVKCYDCGKDLLHSNKEYFFDKDIEERITICPECWGNRKQTGGKVKPTEDTRKPSKKITNYNKLIYGTIGFILIIILLFTLFSFYNITVEAIDSYSDLSTLNSKLQDVKDELDSVNSQINSAENQLSDVATEVLLLQSGNRYELHDPTYSEVISFFSTDTTNSNNYGSGYTCIFFSKDVNNNAEQQGIRCAYVELEFVDSGHAIVAFETTDEGLVYFEPQHDVKANIQIGSRYYTCLAQLPGYLPWEAPGYDDTIESIIRFW